MGRYVMVTNFKQNKMVGGLDLYTDLKDAELKQKYQLKDAELEIVEVKREDLDSLIFNDNGEVINENIHNYKK